MDSQTVQLPRLYPKQLEVFYAADRISVCEASTKAGKTVGALHWLLHEGLKDTTPTSALYLSYVYAQAEAMCERVTRWMTAADPGQRIWSVNRSKLVLTVGQCRIYFKGADNYDAIYGSDYTRAVVDEASRMREAAWFAVVSTLTATRGPVRIIGNVKGRKNWAFRLARKAESGYQGMCFHKLTAADAINAGVLSADSVEEARGTMPEQDFRELYYAEPTEDGSNPFGLQHIAACLLPPGLPLPMGTDAAVCWGVDLAKSIDWTVVYGMGRDGSVVRMERWQKAPWDETIRRVAELIGGQPALVDETGVGSPVCDELRRLGCCVEGFTFTPIDKQKLMGRLSVAIQKREIKFPDGPTRAELESFEYEHTASGVRYSAPSGMHDDCVCALALAVWKWDTCTRGCSTVMWADELKKRETAVVDYDKARADPDWGFDE